MIMFVFAILFCLCGFWSLLSMVCTDEIYDCYNEFEADAVRRSYFKLLLISLIVVLSLLFIDSKVIGYEYEPSEYVITECVYGVSTTSSSDSNFRYVVEDTQTGSMKLKELSTSLVRIKLEDSTPCINHHYIKSDTQDNKSWLYWFSAYYFNSVLYYESPKYLYSEIVLPENYTSEYSWMCE